MSKSLRDLVFRALDHSVENGYGEESLKGDIESVAINLLDYDADIEAGRYAVMDVIPHIEAWRRDRRGLR